MRKSIEMLLAAATAVMSCSSPELPMGQGRNIRPNVSAMTLTRGTTTTVDNLSVFKMMSVTDEYIDHKISETDKQTPTDGIYFTAYVKNAGTGTNQNWNTYASASATTATEYYWINENKMVFWSWAPFDSNVKGTLVIDDTPVIPTGSATDYNKLEFSYTLPTHVDGKDADNQQDLIFAGNVESRTFTDGTDNISAATSTNTSYTRTDNQIDIKFHHALSKIQFGVDLTDNTFNQNIKIKKIEIVNVRSTGTCTFTAPSTFTWSDPASTDLSNTWSQSYGTDGVDFSSYGSASPSLPTDWPLNSSNSLYIGDNAFFVIPQTLAANATSISVTFDIDGSAITKTASLPATEWKADHYYTYKIKAHGSMAEFSFSLSLADWSERENYIPIF